MTDSIKTLRIEHSDTWGWVIKYGADVIHTTGEKKKAEGVLDYLTSTNHPEAHDAALTAYRDAR